MDIDKEHIVTQILTRLRQEWEAFGGEITFYEQATQGYDGIFRALGIDFLCFIESEVSVVNYARIRRRILEGMSHEHSLVLLLSPYIPPTLYEELRQAHIAFIDSVGNYDIRHVVDGNRLILLSSIGRRAPVVSTRSYPLFKEAGLRVIFYLLEDLLNVNQPFREIKEHSGVAIGSVKNVMDELQARGFILSTKNRGRVLCEPLRLLNTWAENYQQVLKPKLLLQEFAFRTPAQQDAWQEIALPSGIWWGGECAAALLQGYLFPEVFTLYSSRLPALLMQTGAVRMGDGGITMYKKFWQGDTLPPILIYADLITSGNSRCIEAAQKLLENELPDFK